MRRIEEWVSIPPDLPPLGPLGEAEEAMVQSRSLEYLLRIPARASSRMRQLSCSLLYALCRPWGESPEPRQQAEEIAYQYSPSAESMEPLQWRSNEDRPFSWDTEGLGIGDIDAYFLDSEEPCGWMPTSDVEVYLEENLAVDG